MGDCEKNEDIDSFRRKNRRQIRVLPARSYAPRSGTLYAAFERLGRILEFTFEAARNNEQLSMVALRVTEKQLYVIRYPDDRVLGTLVHMERTWRTLSLESCTSGFKGLGEKNSSLAFPTCLVACTEAQR